MKGGTIKNLKFRKHYVNIILINMNGKTNYYYYYYYFLLVCLVVCDPPSLTRGLKNS